MKKQNFVIQINDKELSFELVGEMLNATRMGLPFGDDKSPLVWLETNEAKELSKLVALLNNCRPEELVRIEGEGENTIVWMDMGLGIPYAGWLLPAFHRWCAKELGILKEEMAQAFGSDDQAKIDEEKHIQLIGIHRLDKKPS